MAIRPSGVLGVPKRSKITRIRFKSPVIRGRPAFKMAAVQLKSLSGSAVASSMLIRDAITTAAEKHNVSFSAIDLAAQNAT